MKWRILCYHVVEPVQAGAFASQLKRFKAAGLSFKPLSECLEKENMDARGLTVSFDDGDRTVCEVAQPILDDLGIKAILYLTTDYVLRGETYAAPCRRPAVSWEQLGHWLDAGHEIGAHTHGHVNLTKCSSEQCLEELEKSRALIERELGISPVDFSYPWGQYNPAALQVLKRTSWRSAATINRGWNHCGWDPFTLRRDVVEPDWTHGKLHFLLALGSIGPLYKLQRWLRIR
jgi:peptidoglycan/xylan/chitin deacetylase (PgdA/CDA1 family)